MPLDVAVSFEILDPTFSREIYSELTEVYNLVIGKISVANMFWGDL